MAHDQSKVLSRSEAERIVEGGWRERATCCSDAVVIQCVCRVSVQCPRHGIICAGSHD
jgi:hypothetical protein